MAYEYSANHFAGRILFMNICIKIVCEIFEFKVHAFSLENVKGFKVRLFVVICQFLYRVWSLAQLVMKLSAYNNELRACGDGQLFEKNVVPLMLVVELKKYILNS